MTQDDVLAGAELLPITVAGPLRICTEFLVLRRQISSHTPTVGGGDSAEGSAGSNLAQ